MGLLLVLLLAAMVSAIAVAAIPWLRRPLPVPSLSGRMDPALRSAVAGVKARLWVMVGLMVCGGIGVFLVAGLSLRDHGRTVAYPLFAAAIGVALVTLWPRRRVAQEGQAREADLTARTAASTGARWALALPMITGGALAIVLIATGLTSVRDDADGSFSSFGTFDPQGGVVLSDDGTTVAGLEPSWGSTGPYPGWAFGVIYLPLIAVALGLLAWALLRNARAAAWQGRDGAQVDALARAAVARGGSLAVTLLFLLVIEGLAAACAGAWWSASWRSDVRMGDAAAAAERLDTHDPTLLVASIGALVLFVAALALGGLLLRGFAMTLRAVSRLGREDWDPAASVGAQNPCAVTGEALGPVVP